eukprot:scpid14572/ scgid3372/ Acyl-CoA synthetase family member 4; Aminoadipate-semialdehyde dehydrogenase; Protein NRPS998
MLHDIADGPSSSDERIAVIYCSRDGNKSSRRHVSGTELLLAAESVRHELAQHRTGLVVGVYSPADLYLPSCLLGILQAGLAFLPIDLSLSRGRRLSVANHFSVCYFIVKSSLIQEFSSLANIPSACILHQSYCCFGNYCVLSYAPDQQQQRSQSACSSCVKPTLHCSSSSGLNTANQDQNPASPSSIEVMDDVAKCHVPNEPAAKKPKLVSDSEYTAANQHAGDSFTATACAFDVANGADADGGDSDAIDKQIAYVMCTSGTTGAPKVVSVPHQCIVPNIHHLSKTFGLGVSDTLLVSSPYTFDPFIVQIFLGLRSRATLVMVSQDVLLAPEYLLRVIMDESVTVFQPTPSLFARFSTDQMRKILSPSSCLRVLAFGGELCPSPADLGSIKHADNSTRLYDLYGITEVSSWASCHAIDVQLPARNFTFAPEDLLEGTEFEVRCCNSGMPLSAGKGQLWLGGYRRVCVLSGEDELTAGVFRNTGDLACLNADGSVTVLGRSDRQIKRNGQRINLDELQEVMHTFSRIAHCVFFEVSADGRQANASDIHNTTPLHLVMAVQLASDVQEMNAGAQKRMLWADGVKKLLSSPCWPDCILIVDEWPVTNNGKTDIQHLRSLLLTEKEHHLDSGVVLEAPNLANITAAVHNIVEELLDPSGADAFLSLETSFVQAGGDSIRAVRFGEQFLHVACVKGWLLSNLSAGILVDCVLHKSCSALLDLLLDTLMTNRDLIAANEEESQLPATPAQEHGLMQHAFETSLLGSGSDGSCSVDPPCVASTGSAVPSDNVALPSLVTNRHLSRGICACSLMPAGQSTYCRAHSSLARDFFSNVAPLPKTLDIEWKLNLHKCVDASALVVLYPEPCVVISSHSGQVVCAAVETGYEKWRTCLPDRIEGSATLSACGCSVIVGCYDGCIYTCSMLDGGVLSSWQTSDIVKCAPAVDMATGNVWCGSHDGHVYCLQLESESSSICDGALYSSGASDGVDVCSSVSLLCKLHCGGGAVLAKVCVDSEHSAVYTATLAGFISAISSTDYTVLWRINHGVPFFSSPVLTGNSSESVCVTAVNGDVLQYRCIDGSKMWQVSCNAQVFSAPTRQQLHTNHAQSCSVSKRTTAPVSVPGRSMTDSAHGDNVDSSGLLGGNSPDVLPPLINSYLQSCNSVECILLPTHNKEICVIDMTGHVMHRIPLSAASNSAPYVISAARYSANADALAEDQLACSGAGGEPSEPSGSCAAEQLPCSMEHEQCVCRNGPFIVCATTLGKVSIVPVCPCPCSSSVSPPADAQLPGQVFSSPIVCGPFVLLGCRDDFLYCLRVRS